MSQRESKLVFDPGAEYDKMYVQDPATFSVGDDSANIKTSVAQSMQTCKLDMSRDLATVHSVSSADIAASETEANRILPPS